MTSGLSGLVTIDVTGRFVDLSDRPANGHVLLVPVNRVAGNGWIVVGTPVRLHIRNGVATGRVITNQAALSGELYIRVTEQITGEQPPEPTYVVKPEGTTLDLTTAPRVTNPPPGQLFVPASALGQPGGVATLDSSGKLTLSQRPPGGGGGVTSHHDLEDLADGDDHPQYLNTARGDGRYVRPGQLATVATTGAYNDLSGRPTIPDSYDDLSGVVPTSALPALAVTEYLGPAADQTAMLGLVGQKGDWVTRTDLGTVWVITGNDPAQLASWTALSYPTAPVVEVNGQTGVVTLAKGDIGLGNVADIAPADLPVSTAQQNALDLKASADIVVAKTLLNAKGDLIGASGDDTPARLPVGSDGQVPVADSSQPLGIRWSTPPGGIEAFASSGRQFVAFGPCNTSGTWTLCPAAYRVAIPAAAGDLLTWAPRIIAGIGGGDAEIDVASVIGGVPVRYYSSGTTNQAPNGHGGLYLGANYANGLNAINWIVDAADLDGGTVMLALMYRSGGSGAQLGSTVYPGQVDVTNHGQTA